VLLSAVQCEIIHGLFVGNALEPSAALTALLLPVLQQLQPAPCRCPTSADVRGWCALRSLVACATRADAGMVDSAGAVSNARGAIEPQPGHACGSRNFDIGLVAVKPPHWLQAYSYSGMTISL